MFQNDRYITRGIRSEVNSKNPVTYIYLWNLIDTMGIPEGDKDYLQVFILSTKEDDGRKMQMIEHQQEVPPYKSLHYFYTDWTVDTKIFVIDDGEQSIMFLADEY